MVWSTVAVQDVLTVAVQGVMPVAVTVAIQRVVMAG
jgi:hypothetical protein